MRYSRYEYGFHRLNTCFVFQDLPRQVRSRCPTALHMIMMLFLKSLYLSFAQNVVLDETIVVPDGMRMLIDHNLILLFHVIHRAIKLVNFVHVTSSPHPK